MDLLPKLRKNAYLTLLIKDNNIYAHLSFTDITTQRSYIISDRTDLSPLKFRLDDIVFSKEFWFEYFNSLEKNFDWDIVDRGWGDMFKIKEFENEEVGVSGIKVIVDDNQPFFKNVYLSLKEFSKDIVLRILDDKYMGSLISGMGDRLGYEDVVWLDLDFSHFTIFRARKEFKGRERVPSIEFSSSKIDWSNEVGLIDSVRSSKMNAFLSVDSSLEEISNKWANCIAHSCSYLSDQILGDIIRAFTTLQILSIKHSNEQKFRELGRSQTAIFLSGDIPNLLGMREMLLSTIDGLELEGMFDVFVDRECKVLALGKSMIEKENSQDIIVLKGDVLPPAFKLLIPEVPSKSKSKIVFSGKIYSQLLESRDIHAFGSMLDIIRIPKRDEKVLIEGELKNGTHFPHLINQNIQFMSVSKSLEYEYLIVDSRKRPIIYGPSAYENRIKLKVWNDGDKE